MRILAIRGANLASLAEPFELDFERPPLDRYGLFVISGATGAGKSSILDALCLALFDRMPRLPDGHGTAVGRADEDEALRLRSTDPRSILRRGAGAGYAEVDFLGADRGRYRARWEVRRARNRPGGRIQAQQMALSDLASGRLLGGTKTETLEAIRRRLGLSFDQFRRSVLLAQGDFAAFLKADADARAGLLERITGTGLYSRLSKAAHQRAVDEEQALRQLQQRLADQAPLAENERQALEQRRADLEKACHSQERLVAAQQRILDWHQRQSQLQAERAAAAQAEAAALTAWEQADPRRQALDRSERAQPLRPLVAAIERARADLGEAAKQLSTQTRQLQARQRQAQLAQQQLTQAETALTRAETARRAVRPELQQARALDIQLAEQQRDLDRQTQRLKTRQTESQEAGDREQTLRRARDQAHKRLTEADAWLRDHNAYALMASEWGRWEAELGRYRKLARERTEANQQQARLGREAAEAATAIEQARQHRTERAAELERQARNLKQLEQWAGESPLQALQQQRTGLEAEQASWRRARDLQREAAGLAQQADSDRRALADAVRTGKDAANQAANADRALTQGQAALIEARRALDLLQAASNRQTGELRALLRDGEPCPVCGARAHPWQQHPAPLDEETQAQRERVQALHEECDAQLAIRAAQRQRQAQAENEQNSLQPRLAAAEARLAELEIAWRALPEPQRPGPRPQAGELGATLDQALAELERRLSELAKSERQALSLETEIKERRRDLEQLQLQERTQAEALHRLEREQQVLVERLSSQREQVSKLDQQLAQLAETLVDPLGKIPNWRSRLKAEPEALHRDCAAWVGSWREQQDSREAADGELKIIDPALTGAGEARKQAAERLGEQTGLTEQAQARLQQLETDRGRLLDGRPADQVEHSLEQALNDARQLKDQCAAGLNDSRQALAKTQQAIQHWEQEHQRRRQTQSEAELEFEQALQAQGLEAAELMVLLQRDQTWIRTERQALQDLQLSLERARTLHRDTERRQSQHAADAPEASREQAETALADAGSELQRKRNELAEQTALIKQDDARRKRSRQLLEDLETQRREWELWGGLKELIGSADGKKFRGFAQGLTLDSLLVHANLHLQDLARRYRLQRVPGSDLELQVIDTDMGDEVRSVHSLSGGESFLVSLALALGLASLSSSRTQVESLFIDEGFGSLDQDTLDLALASLDTLQSLGRKVGVISHVQAMVERIGAQVLVEKRGAGQSRVRVEVQA